MTEKNPIPYMKSSDVNILPNFYLIYSSFTLTIISKKLVAERDLRMNYNCRVGAGCTEPTALYRIIIITKIRAQWSYITAYEYLEAVTVLH